MMLKEKRNPVSLQHSPLLHCSLECEQDLCWASWCSVKLLSYIMLGRGGRDIKKEKSQRECTL
jgi:hypothetical protein